MGPRPTRVKELMGWPKAQVGLRLDQSWVGRGGWVQVGQWVFPHADHDPVCSPPPHLHVLVSPTGARSTRGTAAAGVGPPRTRSVWGDWGPAAGAAPVRGIMGEWGVVGWGMEHHGVGERGTVGYNMANVGVGK